LLYIFYYKTIVTEVVGCLLMTLIEY